MSKHFKLLDIADRIGWRIIKQAIWCGDYCTWEIMAPDMRNPMNGTAVPKVAKADLYEGATGIALFLLELSRCLHTDAIRRTAHGAIKYSLAQASSMSAEHFGFYSGRVGVAYVAAKAGIILECPAYLDDAANILTQLSGREAHDRGIDVIGGAAGAIPPLLELRSILDPSLVTTIACRLGDHLIRVANRELVGWSWSSPRTVATRNLTGFAHGAAGVGSGLLELYLATSCGRYLYAAEQAFMYERRFFDPVAKNWPDFRDNELQEYLAGGRVSQLRRALDRRRPSAPGTGRRCMRTWCHGAPGIGLSRLRAYEVLGGPIYAAEVRASLATTQASLAERPHNFSLCHGVAGNCETLLQASVVMGDAKLEESAQMLAQAGGEVYERKGARWPCGTLGGVSDPGLMLGEAGIGYFFLRLAQCAPSILFIRGPRITCGRSVNIRVSYAKMHQDYLDAYFGRGRRIIERLGIGNPYEAIDPVASVAKGEAPVYLGYNVIRHQIETEKNALRRQQLEDAFLIDFERFRMIEGIDDFWVDISRQIDRSGGTANDWVGTTVWLAPQTRLIRTRWDWDQLLQNPREPEDSALPEPPNGVHYALWRAQGRIHLRRLSTVAMTVLGAARVPTTFAEITRAVSDSMENDEEVEAVHHSVRAVLDAAFRAGILECSCQRSASTRGERALSAEGEGFVIEQAEGSPDVDSEKHGRRLPPGL